MILAEKLTKTFEDFVAVNAVDLNVPAGEVLALLGPNGAGKTTTIRMLTSVLRPSSGRAVVAGYDVVDRPREVRRSVGVLTENHGLYNRMPAREYLQFFGQLYGIESVHLNSRINLLLERFDLSGFSKRRIGEYSKGMRQKLALARAMLHEPPVLLLDEPTSAMDPESAKLVRNMIAELGSNHRAILICTHNLAEAEELADRIAIIRGGSIIEAGTSAELRSKLLGTPVFELKFNQPLNGLSGPPSGVMDLSLGENWIRYATDQPEVVNPLVLRWVMEQGYGVIYLQEVPRSLEKVYLEAVSDNGGNS
ncbi:MAG: ABC transporter ATP-binding protein [Anaerolineales bacterium]